MERESMTFDVLIIGAGPSGLSAAIRLKQLAQEKGEDLSVCVLEKGAEVGSHILSGAVFEPRALDELIPNWREGDCPVSVEVKEDKFIWLVKKGGINLPTPPQMHNAGNYIISLGALCRWLAEQAESLGVEIYPGFAAREVLYNEHGAVKGVRTGDMGVGKDGTQTDAYTPGMDLLAKQTMFAEGCRGSLAEDLIAKFNLRENANPQTYGLGIKEVWQIDPEKHHQGRVVHTIGWPLDSKTYGGSFIYHTENNQVLLGFVTGLDYKNPYFSPFEAFQRFKTHPKVANLFEGATRVSYGARALNEGGFQSIPKLTFPGGMVIGCSAGFLNVAKIKGTHTAMKSGMIAAETVIAEISAKPGAELTAYEANIKASWIWQELKAVRNIRPGFRWGLIPGLINAALETYVFRGKTPWTLKHHADHKGLKKKQQVQKPEPLIPDGKLTFDRLSSVFAANVGHEENQPAHLTFKDAAVPVEVNYKLYGAPEQYYCPAHVYEIVDGDDGPSMQVNAANCVHCKTCDIKDPTQNIKWVTPEGGGGPNYTNM